MYLKSTLSLWMGVSLMLCCEATFAQHCPPITESYLSSSSVTNVDDSVVIKNVYTKSGGRPHKAYQAYLLAYLASNEESVPGPADESLIDPMKVAVLQTKVIRRNMNGTYSFVVELDRSKLAKDLVDQLGPKEDDRSLPKAGDRLGDSVRLAVFIPFLEDKQHSTLDELPEDRHECNYQNDRALLFQQLPYSLDIRVRREDQKQFVYFNGTKPAKQSVK